MIYFDADQFSPRYGDHVFTVSFDDDYEIALAEGSDLCCTATPEKIVQYRISMKAGRNSWIVRHRYNDFVALAAHLLDLYPEQLTGKLPALPPKTYFTVLRDKAFLDGRKAQLSRYAHLLLRVLNETKLMPDQKVEEFFGFATAVKIKPDDFDRKYAILDTVLGKGTFGEVRLGENRQTKEKVAIKLISKQHRSKIEMDFIKSEVSMLHACEHENIIRLLHHSDTDASYRIVTELVCGGELFDRIVQRDHYSEREARDTVRVLLSVLQYLHGIGITHRDLKPENILLCSDGPDAKIKLADFGLAAVTEDLRAGVRVVCGTPGFLAPEMLTSDCYDDKVDVWSLGVVTYMLLSGQPPFYARTRKELFRKVCCCEYAFEEQARDCSWGAVSDVAKDFIRMCLTADPAQRWSARELLQSHPWLSACPTALGSIHLGAAREKIKRYSLKAVAAALVTSTRVLFTINSGTGDGKMKKKKKKANGADAHTHNITKTHTKANTTITSTVTEEQLELCFDLDGNDEESFSHFVQASSVRTFFKGGPQVS